jgi:hypothetical protein
LEIREKKCVLKRKSKTLESLQKKKTHLIGWFGCGKKFLYN